MPKLNSLTIGYAVAAAALLAILSSLIAKLSVGDVFFYSLWSDRDLYRAFFLLGTPQYSGAESNFGGRIPGGALYYLTWLLQQVSAETTFIRAALVLLQLVGAIFVYLATRTIASYPASLFAAAAMFVFPIHYNTINSVWNPAYVTIFVGWSYWLLALTVQRRNWNLVPWMVLLISIGAQFHFSTLLLLPIALVVMWIFKVRPEAKFVGLSVVALVVSFLPYIAWDISNGFSNLKMLLDYKSLLNDTDKPEKEFWPLLVASLRTSFEFLSGYREISGGATLAGVVKKVAALSAPAVPLILAVVALAVRVPVLFNTTKSQEESYDAKIVMTLSVVLLVVPLVLLSFGFPITGRYLYPTLPALFVLAGKALDDFAGFEVLKPTLLKYLVVLGIASAPLAVGVEYFLKWPGSLVPTKDSFVYEHYKELGRFAALDLGLSPERASERLGAFTVDESGQVYSLDRLNTAFSYPVLLATLDAEQNNLQPKLDAVRDRICAAAFRTAGDAPLSEDKAIKAVSSFTGITGTPEIIGTTARDKFSYVIYSPASGNCARSLNNKYVWLEEEQWVDAELEQADYGAAVLTPKTPDTRLYGVKIEGMSDINIGIEVKSSGAETSFRIISNALRGYTGVIDNRMASGALRLEGCNNTVNLEFPKRQSHNPNPPVDWPNFVLRTTLSESCDYRLSFHATGFVSELRPLGDIDVLIDDKFSLSR